MSTGIQQPDHSQDKPDGDAQPGVLSRSGGAPRQNELPLLGPVS